MSRILKEDKRHTMTSNASDTNAIQEEHRQAQEFQWTTITVLQSIAIFCLAGVAEIIGGWMVWVAVRGQGGIENRKPWYYALVGSLVLIGYGFIPCLQPTDNFGRIYAAYGGFFIVLSFLFGWALDGDKPDLGDVVGGVIAIAGACVLMFWPR